MRMAENGNRNFYKIAFCGAFEIANYGDHLFPIVFKEALKERGINVQLFLFSPMEGVQAFDLNEKVYSLRDLEKHHLEQGFDAIVVGGGELIHFSSSPQLPGMGSLKQYMNYKIYETWLIPSLFALKYDVKIIWNIPGCSYEFPKFYKHFIKALCQDVDYISIRNISSKNILVGSGLAESIVHLYPDSAFAMRRYIRTNPGAAKNMLGFGGSYAVYHANRHVKDEDLPNVINTLNYLSDKGYKIVLLPLAYTHDDKTILSRINQLAGNRYFLFNRNLTIYEMMSILGECDIYIGISFHGAVTTLSYNKKAIVYDYIGSIKTKDLFNDLKIGQYYVTDSKLMLDQVEDALSNYPDIDISPYMNQLSEHFDYVESILQSNETYCDFTAFLRSFSDGVDALTDEIKYLYERVNGFQKDNQELQKDNRELEARRAELQVENDRLNNQVNEILSSRTWRYAKKISKLLRFDATKK